MLPMGIKVSHWSSVLAVTSTVSLTFSGWKWHLWHSLSESNIFTSVGASSIEPLVGSHGCCKGCALSFFSRCRQLAVTRLQVLITPGCCERPLLMLYLAQCLYGVFSSGVSPFIALNFAKPAWTHTRMCWQCGRKLFLYEILQCTCRSDDGQGHVSPLGLSRKAFLNIFCSSCCIRWQNGNRLCSRSADAENRYHKFYLLSPRGTERASQPFPPAAGEGEQTLAFSPGDAPVSQRCEEPPECFTCHKVKNHTCVFIKAAHTRAQSFSRCENSPTQDETCLQISNPSQRTFHHPQFSSKLQPLSLWTTFIYCSLSATPQDFCPFTDFLLLYYSICALHSKIFKLTFFSHTYTACDQDAAAWRITRVTKSIFNGVMWTKLIF